MDPTLNNPIHLDTKQKQFFRILDKGIADMELGRELPLKEAFEKITELRRKNRKSGEQTS